MAVTTAHDDDAKPKDMLALADARSSVDDAPSAAAAASTALVRDWSEAEERRVVRRLDMVLMPLLVLGFFALQLDRSNIANALTSSITTDLGVSRADIAGGNQLQLAGIVLAEIPANLVLQRVGPNLWLTAQCLAWGLVGMLQAFITNRGSYYATRLLLGVCEAGYIPGAMLTMSLFYTRREIAVRTAVFYFGNYFSAGTGSLIAAGVLRMDGVRGLAGWRWLFLIDGSMTLVMFILFILLLPSTPLQTQPLCRVRALDLFSPRDQHIMHTRVLLDDPAKHAPLHASLSFTSVLKTLLVPKLWAHMLVNLVGLVPKGGLSLYAPTIIKSLGFSTTDANALSSISNYGVCILSFLVSWLSDRTRQRGLCCMTTCIYPIVFCAVLYALPITPTNAWTRFAIFTLLNSGNGIIQTLNDAWLSSNADSHNQRSIGLAMAVMGSNLGGLAGQQLFQEDDAPRYNKAFGAILGLYAASLVGVGGLMALYWRENRKVSDRGTVEEEQHQQHQQHQQQQEDNGEEVRGVKRYEF